jgi:hypothetical protein
LIPILPFQVDLKILRGGGLGVFVGGIAYGAWNASAAAGTASHGNAVDTPAANAVTQSLGNTDAGILTK